MNSSTQVLNQKHYTQYLPLIIRLTTGWIYFSAFWRRTALATKLDPEAAGYVGEKFNNFLPNALFIKPLIRWLVENPETLWINMLAFTIIECIVGLFLMFGFFTRLASFGATLLAGGILMGSGWLGTTCLDEWQIGVFGIITGAYLFFAGGGSIALDQKFRVKKVTGFWMSTDLSIYFNSLKLKRAIVISAFATLLITLGTNQYFHGGVWGTLHNLSKNPKVEIYRVGLEKGFVTFEAMRTEGIDTYGSFVIEARLENSTGEVLQRWDDQRLAALESGLIQNRYVAEVTIGKHGLEFPLGALAEIKLPLGAKFERRDLKLVLEDVSGKTWMKTL